jgi:hypothetical protein
MQEIYWLGRNPAVMMVTSVCSFLADTKGYVQSTPGMQLYLGEMRDSPFTCVKRRWLKVARMLPRSRVIAATMTS